MITFPRSIFNQLCLKNTHSLPRNERMHYFKKKTQKLQICQHFFGFQLAGAEPVCRAGGKPSIWFPPGTRRAGHPSDKNVGLLLE